MTKMYKVTLPEVELVEYLIEVEDDVSENEVIELVMKGEGQMHKTWPEGSFVDIDATVRRAWKGTREPMYWRAEIEED